MGHLDSLTDMILDIFVMDQVSKQPMRTDLDIRSVKTCVPQWPNGEGVGLLNRRLWVQVPSGVVFRIL